MEYVGESEKFAGRVGEIDTCAHEEPPEAWHVFIVVIVVCLVEDALPPKT